MKFSIVTAVWNRADTLGQAIRSLDGQSHAVFEHLVQDAGSDDGTLGVLADHADPRRVVVSAPDGGIYDALNRGMARATGDVVGLLHSDDFYADDGVLACVAACFARTGADAVYGDLDYVASDDPGRIVRRWRSGGYAPERLARGWMPPHPTVFVRRAVIDTWGGYDTRYRIAADYESLLRYFRRGDVTPAYLPQVLVKMRLGGESNKSLRHVLRKSAEDMRAMRAHGIDPVTGLLCKNLSKLGQFLPRTM